MSDVLYPLILGLEDSEKTTLCGSLYIHLKPFEHLLQQH